MSQNGMKASILDLKVDLTLKMAAIDLSEMPPNLISGLVVHELR